MHTRHLNEQLVRVLKTIGYDVGFQKGQGQYLFDRQGARYLDLLSGFGVFAIGGNHPDLRKALKSVLDADLPNLVQLDVSTLEKISCMTPGCLEDWPIDEQKNLFSLLAGVESMLGVRLTESLLMIPRKSVSGIYFPTEVSFSSCQLCPRESCDNRKAGCDEAKARRYGILK